jgi:hypothetical protein
MKQIIPLLVFAVVLVFGMFTYADLNQVDMARAELNADIVMERQPAPVQTAAAFGETLIVKILSGVIASLIVTACIVIYKQRGRIAELQGGGWDRFYSRRALPEPKQPREKKPGVIELMSAVLLNEIQKKKGRPS